MENLIKFDDVNNKIITIRNQSVILDSDVAALYGVETKRVNEAISNNPKKFPEGYFVQLNKDEWINLKSKISPSKQGGKNKLPNVFTEKGLYMLATILKSDRATEATIAIIEAFTKIRELSRNIAAIQDATDEVVQHSLLQRSGQIINDVLFPNALIDSSETSVELNLGLLKVKHAVKSGNPNYENDLREIKQMLEKMSSRA